MAQTFIDSYIDHTKIYETPISFWRWSGYSIISTILRDRCYIKNGDSYLFPNLYILFLAESSGHRKNRPIELSETITSKVTGVRTISGRASVQALLDELATTESDAKGKVVKCNSATFYAPELSAGIVNDPEGLKILTDIYDVKPNIYKARLRSRPNFNLERIVFSMLSASNPDMLTGLFDTSVIRGGFLARTLLVTPNEFRPSNSLMRIDHEQLKISLNTVIENAKRIGQLYGEYNFTEGAMDEFEKWYNPFRQEYHKKKEVSGIVGRIHTHALKLSMILAANEQSLCILKCHMENAINECLSLIPNYGAFTMNNAKSEVGNAGGVIITDMLAAKDHILSRKTLIRSHWQDFEVELMDKALAALEEANMIKVHSMKDGIYYQLTQQCVEMLT